MSLSVGRPADFSALDAGHLERFMLFSALERPWGPDDVLLVVHADEPRRMRRDEALTWLRESDLERLAGRLERLCPGPEEAAVLVLGSAETWLAPVKVRDVESTMPLRATALATLGRFGVAP